jgi:hypothetical protein
MMNRGKQPETKRNSQLHFHYRYFDFLYINKHFSSTHLCIYPSTSYREQRTHNPQKLFQEPRPIMKSIHTEPFTHVTDPFQIKPRYPRI